jgi:cysteine synthase
MTVLERVGSTPLPQLEGLFIKRECSNPGGSVKDRIARFMLEEAARRGELLPDDHIVEATSGNTGIALAFVGRQLGYRVLIFMPEHMSPERRRMMENLGAEVRLTPRAESFRGAIARRDAFRGRTGYYIPDQFANPDNVRCHALTTGHELVQQLRDRGHHGLDWFVAGVGTGGTLMGVARALRAHMPGVAIAAVEPEESAVLSGASRAITHHGHRRRLRPRSRRSERYRPGASRPHRRSARGGGATAGSARVLCGRELGGEHGGCRAAASSRRPRRHAVAGRLRPLRLERPRASAR